MSARPPENERELVELIRSIDAPAPAALHRRTEALVAEHLQRHRAPAGGLKRRARLLFAPSLAVVSAVTAVVLVLLLSNGSSPRLSVHSAAALTVRAATAGAPAESGHERAELTTNVDGIAFPYWEERFGWRSSGMRTDHIAGRVVRTVFYADQRGRRVGYAIVAGTPAPQLRGGMVHWRGGTPYRLLVESGIPVVVWLREGHLCVVGGRGIDEATLLRLASWDEHAARV